MNRFVVLIILCLLSIINVKAQWVRTSKLLDGHIRCFAVSDTNLFAGTYEDGVYLSTDKGISWVAANTGLPNTVFTLAVAPNAEGGTNLFAGTFLGGVFLSSDNGTNWTPVNYGLTGVGVHALAVCSTQTNGTNIYAGISGGGVFLSTNDGTSWTAVNNGFAPPEVIYTINDLTVYGNSIYAATGFGVFLSAINDTNWNAINTGLTSNNVRTIAVCSNVEGDTILFAGTYTNGIFRSTNNGANWLPANTGLTSTVIYSFAITFNSEGKINIFAGISGGGVFLSTNYGTNWAPVNSGLTTEYEPSVFALTVCGTDLFAGTDDGVWRRPLSEMTTEVKDKRNEIPSSFILEQNYPNPFNPATTIRYELSSATPVSLPVYDLLGREVVRLVEGYQQPGIHESNWDGNDTVGHPLTSGIYIARLVTPEYIKSIKMVLLK